MRKDLPHLSLVVGSVSLTLITAGIISPVVLSMVKNTGIAISANLLSGLQFANVKKCFVTPPVPVNLPTV